MAAMDDFKVINAIQLIIAMLFLHCNLQLLIIIIHHGPAQHQFLFL